MQILNLISLLLDYPEDNSAQFLLVARNIIAQTILPPTDQERIGQLLDHFQQDRLGRLPLFLGFVRVDSRTP